MDNKINKSVVKLLVERDRYETLYKEAFEALQEIHNRIYSIGAPLNDNCLGFNSAQLKYIKIIADICYNLI